MNQAMDSRIYRLTEFDQLPDVPGIYAWYLYHRQQFSKSEYYRFFKSKKLDVYLKAPLMDIHIGEAISLLQTNVQEKAETLNDWLLELATMQFSPPIYIGITGDQTLKIRLTQHKLLLERLLSRTLVPDTPADDKFASRVNSILKNQGMTSINESCFFAKIVEAPSVSKSEIEGVEYFVNRTFHPFLGRR